EHRVEHGLHALVLERRARQHRERLASDGELTDRGLDLVLRQLLTAEVLLHELVVGLGSGLHEPLTVFSGLVGEIGRALLDLVVLALLRLTTPGEGLHADQIDNTLEVALSADRQLDDERPRAETLLDGADRVVEVGAELVHLVDEADTRNLVLVRLPPNLLGLRLDTFLAVEDGDGTVEHTQRTLHLNSEVDVAGCVDDVDLVVVPEGGGSSRGNSDTPLLLLLHPVHRRRTLMGLTELVVDPGVEQ